MTIGHVAARKYFKEKGGKIDKSSTFFDKQNKKLTFKSKKHDAVKAEAIANTKYYKKLFEEFFIVGPNDEEIKGIDGVRFVRPKKTFQYPNNISEEVK